MASGVKQPGRCTPIKADDLCEQTDTWRNQMLLGFHCCHSTIKQFQLLLLQQKFTQRQSKLAEFQLTRHGFEEQCQNRWDNSQKGFMVVAVCKIPCLNQVRETDSFVVVSPGARNLRVAKGFQHTKFLCFFVLILNLTN